MPHATPLPNIGGPATRALAGVGITTLDDLRGCDFEVLQSLHGVGPKAIRVLRAAMVPVPADTARLRFRPMTQSDLPDMEALLGDPAVMAYYPAPKSRDEARAWIAWNQSNYAEHGFGLWIIETLDGEFVGDCGLTWQSVNGHSELEVGYHVRTALQRRGFATEAAAACRDFARDSTGAARLVAIIHPDNDASRRVAEKIGMVRMADALGGEIAIRHVLGMELSNSPGRT